MSVLVVAIGGNALTRAGEQGSHQEQRGNAAQATGLIRRLVADGHRVVLTHGNGPQVGNLAIQQEEGRHFVPAQPLFVLGAMTQGQIGHLLTSSLTSGQTSLPGPAAVITHVLVDRDDPAFRHPTKPIGPFFSPAEARRLAEQRGWEVAEDAGRGWRRVVPSPEPQEILEAGAIRSLVEAGHIVVASGGGGIPVVREGGDLLGVDAVIDKDLAARRLASAVGADTLMLLTGVEQVTLDFGRPTERPLACMTVVEAERYLAEGQFPAGSMGPKITAAVRFLQDGGEVAIITSLGRAREALAGSAGTRIVPKPTLNPTRGRS